MKNATLLLLLALAPSLYAADIPFTDSNLLPVGWTTSGATRFPNTQDGAIYFKVNIGTNTLKTTFYGTQAFKFSIDGGSTISVSPLSSSVPTLTTISSSLSPGSHDVYAWGSQSDTVISTAAAFTTDGSGSLADTRFGTLYETKTGTLATYGKIRSCPWQTTSLGTYASSAFAYDATMGGNSADAGEAYYATGDSQSVYVYAGLTSGGAGYALYQDGVSVGTASTSANGGVFQMLFITGLDSGQHLYEWISNKIQSGPNGIVFVMPSGSVSTVTAAAKSCVGIYGDSITALSAVTPGDSRLAWWAATYAAGFDNMRMGQGGQKVVTFGRDNTAAITGGANGVPTIVIHAFGVNDQQAYTGPSDITTFQTAALTELQNMDAGPLGGSRQLWQYILPNAAGNSAQRGAYNTAIAAAVASYNGGAHTTTACAYDTTGWINTTTDTIGDALHPILQNAASTTYPFGNPLLGYGKISNRLSFILSGYGSAGKSFTFTGPAFGYVGVDSAVYTLTPSVTGAVFNGEPITLSDGGAGGTFTPNLTALTDGASSVTFTYKGTSIGVKTISVSGLANCWTAPPSLTFGVSATDSFSLGISRKGPVTRNGGATRR